MSWMLAVGGPGPELTPSWDFWLPAYIALSFLLIEAFVRPRITPWTAAACFAAGTLWSWLDNAIGVLPAAALAVLVAVVTGAVRRRLMRPGRLR